MTNKKLFISSRMVFMADPEKGGIEGEPKRADAAKAKMSEFFQPGQGKPEELKVVGKFEEEDYNKKIDRNMSKEAQAELQKNLLQSADDIVSKTIEAFKDLVYNEGKANLSRMLNDKIGSWLKSLSPNESYHLGFAYENSIVHNTNYQFHTKHSPDGIVNMELNCSLYFSHIDKIPYTEYNLSIKQSEK